MADTQNTSCKSGVILCQDPHPGISAKSPARVCKYQEDKNEEACPLGKKLGKEGDWYVQVTRSRIKIEHFLSPITLSRVKGGKAPPINSYRPNGTLHLTKYLVDILVDVYQAIQ